MNNTFELPQCTVQSPFISCWPAVRAPTRLRWCQCCSNSPHTHTHTHFDCEQKKRLTFCRFLFNFSILLDMMSNRYGLNINGVFSFWFCSDNNLFFSTWSWNLLAYFVPRNNYIHIRCVVLLHLSYECFFSTRVSNQRDSFKYSATQSETISLKKMALGIYYDRQHTHTHPHSHTHIYGYKGISAHTDTWTHKI